MPTTVTRKTIEPMALLAAEQHVPEPQRLLTDDLAHRLLPGSMRLLVGTTRLQPLRGLLTWVAERESRGLTASLLCRKRYIDDKVHDAADTGIRATIILGAGRDTLAYRHPVLKDISVFELDQPRRIAEKEALLRSVEESLLDHVSLVPIDFSTQALGDVLAANGLDPAWKVFVVWEGTHQRLSAQDVRSTMATLSKLPCGSRLVFTYIRQDAVDGAGTRRGRGRLEVGQQSWQLSMRPENVAPFLAEYGWQEREQLGGIEYTSRYVAATTRPLPVSEAERTVYAEKL